MGNGKQEKRSKSSLPNKNPKRKRLPLGPNRPQKKKKKTKTTSHKKKNNNNETKNNNHSIVTAAATSAEQLSFFVGQYQSANVIQLSSLELESITDKCILKLSQGLAQSSNNLGEHMKAAFGSSWREVLCGKQILEGKIDPGNPALLVISLSALRSLELLRGLQALTKECHAAKLFSKHMKVNDQVSFLKNRVNIASGTPSRIKKLIDMEALGLTRLAVIVLDMQTDVKGYSLFTLPQVRDEFWDLYKNYLHPRLVQGDLRICLYGPTPISSEVNKEVTGD
ncbi:Protein CMSS1 [Camellia lanceoleosa]|uniref:Protein CMSS1 n=1 Tax=Camellia lanceoleosa TaxID=1840588 RepID=A0ACC0H070_9ERIC|nr:Protein CMSS1 [Camellia lanceoleosa]